MRFGKVRIPLWRRPTQVDLRHHVKYGYDDVAQYYEQHKNYYIE